MIALDTNVLLGFLRGNLRHGEAAVLQDNAWSISDIVLWEIGMLERDSRAERLLGTVEFSRLLGRTTVYPIDERVAVALRQLDFRSDPADEIIAATSIVHDIPLLTRDTRILRSKVVPLALG